MAWQIDVPLRCIAYFISDEHQLIEIYLIGFLLNTIKALLLSGEEGFFSKE